MRFIKVSIYLIIVLFASTARAGDCTITSSPVNFGAFDLFSKSSIDATGDVTITCDQGTSFVVKLTSGSYGNFLSRKMKSSEGGEMFYNLYIDPARTKIWGDGTNNTHIQAGTGTGAGVNFIVYGRIIPRKNVRTGTYNDTVTLMVEW